MNKSLPDFDEPDLSDRGQHRRAEILALARRAARARRHRRTARRVGAAAAVALLFIGVFVLVRPRELPRPPIVQRPNTTKPLPIPAPVNPPPRIVVTRIETDPTLLSRWAIAPRKPTWQALSDDELLHGLAEAGRPAGLAYVDGHPMLLFREPTR